MRRNKTVLFICVAACLTTLFGFTGTALAENSGYTGDLSSYGAVLLIDADSGVVLANHNENERIEPASTTKIMTCILALENSDLNAEVTISEKAAGVSGSELKLQEGEKVKMSDLLGGMMMESGNDAATAVAEFISGDVEKFVELMNAKAQALGMAGTHFSNPHGKHDDNHYSTASDMAKLMQYAMKNPSFVEIVDRDSYTMPASNKRGEQVYKNTNFLMRQDKDAYYAYAKGGKQVRQRKRGACLVAAASNDSMNLICLIYKDESTEGVNRWTLAKSLFDYGFNEFSTVDVQTLLEKAEPVKTQIENYASTDEGDGLLQFQGPSSPGTLTTLKKATVDGILNGTDTIEAETSYSKSLEAPILKDDVLGTVTYKSKATGEVIYTGNLIASRDVLQAGAEPDANGGTAVTVAQPVDIEKIKPNDGIYYWLIIPGALIVFLVVRLVTVQRRKRKRFNKRRPHYSYRIK